MTTTAEQIEAIRKRADEWEDNTIYSHSDIIILMQAVEERAAIIAQLRDAGIRAIGMHHAPEDCYATGPLNGNMIEDLVVCPACRFLSLAESAKTRVK